MALRSFHVQDLIALPTLSASETITLVKQLETCATAHKLTGDLADVLTELGIARDALIEAQQRKRAAQQPASPEAVAADRNVDRAWGATSEWLAGWTRLGDVAHVTHANALTAALFAEGVSFVNLPYLGEWAESDLRIKTIHEKKLDVHFRALGGEAFLASLKRTHEAYGKALGITETSKVPAAPAPEVRAALSDTLDTMREYVAKVAASVTKRKPKTAEVAAALLEPITSREVRRRTPSAEAGVSFPPEPPTAT